MDRRDGTLITGTLLTPFEKCLEIGETQILLFIGTFEKYLEMGETQFLLFIGTFVPAPIIYKSSLSSSS